MGEREGEVVRGGKGGMVVEYVACDGRLADILYLAVCLLSRCRIDYEVSFYDRIMEIRGQVIHIFVEILSQLHKTLA